MDEKLTYTGGEPNISFDDLDRNNKANKRTLTAAFAEYGSNYIITGVSGSPVSAGYIMLDGEILQVDSHTATGTHFEKVTTYDTAGDKTFNDTIVRQTWAKNRATVTAGSGSLAYSGALRLPDAIIANINIGTTNISVNRLPQASQSVRGTSELADTTEAQALTDINRTISPGTLADVVGGMITTVIEIGDWDMDATTAIVVAHSLTLSKIINYNVIIRKDDDAVSSPSSLSNLTAGPILSSISFQDAGGRSQVDATEILLSRNPDALFYDNALFDKTSYNRGWIIINHIP